MPHGEWLVSSLKKPTDSF